MNYHTKSKIWCGSSLSSLLNNEYVYTPFESYPSVVSPSSYNDMRGRANQVNSLGETNPLKIYFDYYLIKVDGWTKAVRFGEDNLLVSPRTVYDLKNNYGQ